MIAALDRGRVIGAGAGLPWRLPADLRRFRKITLGKPVIMGRKTHESIGRPLPGRENIILTRDTGYRAAGCTVLSGPAAVFAHCRGQKEIMITGGAEIYRLFLGRARRLYLTRIHAEVGGDTFFPEWRRGQWREMSREDFKADEKNEFDYSFVILERAERSDPARVGSVFGGH